MMVIAAWPQMDDPTKSAVVDKINVTALPHGPGGKSSPTLGHFIGAIPKNVPKDRQVAALAFLRWFQTYDAQVKYAQAGQPPIRRDVYEAPFMKAPAYRWTSAISESSPGARMMYTVPESTDRFGAGAAAQPGRDRREASADALNTAAAEIHEIMRKAGYKTGRLPDLK